MNPILAALRFTLVSRVDCHLCEVMHADLQAFLSGRAAPPITVLDVDADADLQRRFGYKVPVLLIDGEIACCGQFDRDEVARLARGIV